MDTIIHPRFRRCGDFFCLIAEISPDVELQCAVKIVMIDRHSRPQNVVFSGIRQLIRIDTSGYCDATVPENIVCAAIFDSDIGISRWKSYKIIMALCDEDFNEGEFVEVDTISLEREKWSWKKILGTKILNPTLLKFLERGSAPVTKQQIERTVRLLMANQNPPLVIPSGFTQSGPVVNWSPVPGATKYKVEKHQQHPQGGSWAIAQRVEVSTPSFDVGQVTTPTDIKVWALDALNNQGPVGTYSCTLMLPPTALTTPTSLVQQATNVTWSAVPNATGYKVVMGTKITPGAQEVTAPEVIITTPTFDVSNAVQLFSLAPTAEIIMYVYALGTGNLVSSPGHIKLVAVQTPSQQPQASQTATQTTTTTTTTTAAKKSWKEQPLVVGIVVGVTVLAIVTILLAFANASGRRGVTRTSATIPMRTLATIPVAAVPVTSVTPAPPKVWTEKEPDGVRDMMQVSDSGKKPVVIVPRQDIVLITPVGFNVDPTIVSGSGFEYAYNMGSLDHPQWVDSKDIPSFTGAGRPVVKAMRFKAGQLPITLRFCIVSTN